MNGGKKLHFFTLLAAAAVLESHHPLWPAPWRVVGYEHGQEESRMVWTKPEFKEVAVTLEVTAYTARK